MRRGKLSIVIPCFNEQKRLGGFEVSWNEFLSSHQRPLWSAYCQIELIFVDDGSTDATRSLLQELSKNLRRANVTAKILFHKPNRGKGAALRRGILESQGDWILMADLDMSTPLSELFRLMQHQQDFVIASRYLVESEVKRSQPLLRSILGRAFNSYVRWLTRLQFKDTQCGFKLIRGSLARATVLKTHCSDFAFDVELMLLTKKLNIEMKEVPVTWRYRHQSKVSLWRDGAKALLSVAKIAWRNRLSRELRSFW